MLRKLSHYWLPSNPSTDHHDLDDRKTFRLGHYTALEAVVSMLQSSNGGLRLSDSSTMNDPEEGRATRDGRNIKHLLEEQFAPDSWPRRRYDDAHVCCFVGVDRAAEDDVEPGDDLLFWRLYGNDCRGLSITIPTHVSADLLIGRYVQQVTYTDEPPPTTYPRKISLLMKETRSTAITCR